MIRMETIAFQARDGFPCSLLHVLSDRPTPKGPVLLVHGAGVRANIFMPPVTTTVVDYLSDNGYDVWLENWRASIDLVPNRWTLDAAAINDHPAAVALVCARTGQSRIKAIIHCQGSTSFMLSAVAGLLPQISVIVSNAVSLHPIVPAWSRFKLDWMVPLVRPLAPYMNPRWGLWQRGAISSIITGIVNRTHHECANPVCKQVSFVYGSGRPALWSHENLNGDTHGWWLDREFAWVPLSFFEQMARCVDAGHLCRVSGDDRLPETVVAEPPRTDARIAFLAGADNLCFLPESQQRSFAYVDKLRPGVHSLHILPGYGHLDVFIGQNAARDVFPVILQELERSA